MISEFAAELAPVLWTPGDTVLDVCFRVLNARSHAVRRNNAERARVGRVADAVERLPDVVLDAPSTAPIVADAATIVAWGLA